MVNDSMKRQNQDHLVDRTDGLNFNEKPHLGRSILSLGKGMVELVCALPDHMQEFINQNEQWKNSKFKEIGEKILKIYEPIGQIADSIDNRFRSNEPLIRVLRNKD